MMESMTCGPCSQELGLPLEERIRLAMARLPMVDYLCTICNKEHSYTMKGNVMPPPTIGESTSFTKPNAKAVNVKKKQEAEAEAEAEQLTLF